MSIGHARCASFDCGKAATDVEKLICSDPELGKLDQDIGDAYSRTYQSLDGRYREPFLGVQRQWLKRREAIDSMDVENRKEPVDERSRIRFADIRQQWRAQHASKFKEDLNALMQARLDRLKEPTVVTVNSVKLLRLDGDERPPYLLTRLPGRDAYNRWVDQSFERAKGYLSEEEQAGQCGDIRKDVDCDAVWSVSTYSLAYASPELLSVSEEDSFFYPHTAHPSNNEAQYDWWLSKAGRVGVAEIFAGTAWRKAIQSAVDKEVGGAGICVKQCAEPAFDPGNWLLTPKSLQIVGQYYDFVGGRISITIEVPWSRFGGSVRAGFLRKLQRFPPVPGAGKEAQ